MTILATEKMKDSSSIKREKILIDVSYEKKSSWRVIAKNEIKLRTSHFRNHRKLFFGAFYSILFIWAFVASPILFDLFMPTLAAQYSNIFNSVVAIVIESLMMVLFFCHF